MDNQTTNQVVLVDEQDQEIGTMEKMQAHHEGKLHRAFSVLLYNKKGEMLIQQRALHKYHCGGLWTNACCSHPMPNEKLEDAVKRRLKEELGIEAQCDKRFHFIYKAEVAENLFEHELDHVFVGTIKENPIINPEEIADWKFINMDILKEDIKHKSTLYTPWFKLILAKIS